MGLSILAEAGGLKVREVSPGGPASLAGIQAGDVILELEGKKVSAAEDIIRALGDRRVGESIRLALSRQGRRQQLILVLGVMPPQVQEPRSRFPEGRNPPKEDE